MRIEISLEERDPPAGAASAAGAEPRRFVGWLGLLRVLSELIIADQQARPSDGPAGRR